MSAATLNRLRCLYHRGHLDRLIADGANPSSDPELELRARQLVGTRHRKRLADGLRRVSSEADREGWGLSSAPPLAKDALKSAAPSIALLAHRLDSQEPVTPQGAAQVMRLLGDPASPLNSPTGDGELALEARSIRDALGNV